MGDDLLDLPVLRRAGLALAPADAAADVRRAGAPRDRGARRPRRGARSRGAHPAGAGPLAGRSSTSGPARTGDAVSDSYLPMLIGLVALLAGLAIGKAWERYKLRDGRWIDRRKARQSPHYIIGLNYLVSNQLDLAIEELGNAAKVDPDALEIHLILGNLYREKGQVGRAINVHQSLLQRPRLTPLAHAHVLLCLGLDFRRGGFVDRALEAFKEVLRLDPTNRYALANLQKLHEEQHQWSEAYAAAPAARGARRAPRASGRAARR